MEESYPSDIEHQEAIKEQRVQFLNVIDTLGKGKAYIEIAFHGPGVEGVKAQGRVLAIESSLQEMLVENLQTPTGVLQKVRVNLSDVLYVRILGEGTQS